MDVNELSKNLFERMYAMSFKLPSDDVPLRRDARRLAELFDEAKWHGRSDKDVATDLAVILYTPSHTQDHRDQLYRVFSRPRGHGVDPALISQEMEGENGFFARLKEKQVKGGLVAATDAIELAAWVEYELFRRIYPYAQRCDVMTFALSSWILYAQDHRLPVFHSWTKYMSFLSVKWKDFHPYYRSCFQAVE